ncbi:MAG TPA: HEAT repeat domain-containing protein [Blastocatellia bacterium]|nr:HEAT repeat domain-containing protein [Blastocatellia bacterium]
MRKVTIVPAIIALSMAFAVAFAQDQRNYTKANFINVDGSSLNDKIDRAVKQFKTTKLGDTVWLAYNFPAREDARVGVFSGTVYRDSDGIKLERGEDTTQIAVFLLTDASGSQPKFTRVKTLNLSEPYVFEDRPVYWLGNVDANQSIAVIESAMRADAQSRDLARGALRAIATHNSPRSISLLKEVSAKDADVEIQRSAISNLSRVKTQEGLNALIELYDGATSETLKEEIIAGIARNESRKALDKLQAIAKNDANPKMRQRAIRRLTTARGSGIWVN